MPPWLVKMKVFKSGNSQAVRLPKAMRFDVNEVDITKDGDNLILKPVRPNLADAFYALGEYRNNHQKPTFHPLGDFLNPALALLRQGLKKSPIGQKLDFTNHPYLCKGLYYK
jgi:antitoxin VapB